MEKKLAPIEKRGGYEPRTAASPPTSAPPKPSDSAASAQPRAARSRGA
jgi:hypothetical protein